MFEDDRSRNRLDISRGEDARLRVHDLRGSASHGEPGACLESPATCQTDEKSAEQTVACAHGVLRGHLGRGSASLSVRVHERAIAPERQDDDPWASRGEGAAGCAGLFERLDSAPRS